MTDFEHQAKTGIMQVRWGWIAATIILLCAAVVFAAFNGPLRELQEYWLWEYHKRHNQGVGDGIVRALEEYKLCSGHLPMSLSDLVPEYFAYIPKTSVGNREWQYSTRDNGTSYELKFACNGMYPVSWYDSQTQRWRADQ